MDAKEARRELNEIRMLINKWQGDRFPSCVAVVDKAIEALEKQVPKEPYSQEWAEFDTKEGVCNCGWRIWDSQRYCPGCGQKIDWSSDKEL